MPDDVKPRSTEELEFVGFDAPAVDQQPTDPAANKETAMLVGDARRAEEQKREMHLVFIWLIRIVAGAFGIVFMVRVIHYVLPESWHWLKEPQLQAIDKSFFSGIMGALIARYSKQALKSE